MDEQSCKISVSQTIVSLTALQPTASSHSTTQLALERGGEDVRRYRIEFKSFCLWHGVGVVVVAAAAAVRKAAL